MFQGRKVIVCVPSGRYRYLRILLAYLTSKRFAEVIDEIRLWVNTDVPEDLEYFARMEQQFPKIKRAFAGGQLTKTLYDATRDHWQFNDGIYRFYADCVESNTLYVKMDDDICYVHDDFFNNLLRTVIEREPKHYACLGNVFNIPYTSWVHQDRGVIDDKMGLSDGSPRCAIGLKSGEFAAHIHKQFLQLADDGELQRLYFDSRVLVGHQRIGVMAWTGESFQRFGGKVGPSDEIELTTRIPEELKKPLWLVGNALVSHYAFSHQRSHLEDRTNVLGRYLALSIELNGGDVAG